MEPVRTSVIPFPNALRASELFLSNFLKVAQSLKVIFMFTSLLFISKLPIQTLLSCFNLTKFLWHVILDCSFTLMSIRRQYGGRNGPSLKFFKFKNKVFRIQKRFSKSRKDFQIQEKFSKIKNSQTRLKTRKSTFESFVSKPRKVFRSQQNTYLIYD